MQKNIFTGHLATDPELVGEGTKARARIVLISNEYAGKNDDGSPKERAVRLPLTAWNRLAETISKNCRKGDQLIVSYRVENSTFERDGETQHGYNFHVLEMEFGAPGKASRANKGSAAGG